MTTAHPEEITKEQTLAALAALGLEPGEVFDVTIEPNLVTVTYTVRDEGGLLHKPEHQDSYPRLTRTYRLGRPKGSHV